MVRPRHLALAIIVAFAGVAGLAAGKDGGGHGRQVRFVGIHPIPKQFGGGICHIEGPHVHIYAPADPIQYRDHDGAHYFVGDPVAYGWDGDRHAYYGHHPIYVTAAVDGGPAGEPVYCYINGPHYHVFAPPPEVAADFELEGNAYFFVGTPPPIYVQDRPAMVKINAVYQPLEYARPMVLVEPPSAWIGVRFAMPAAEVVVDAPPPVVVAPVVRAGVEVRVPAIVVRPPSIEVGIGVGVGVGGGFVVGGRGRHDDDDRHDNGKHKGWHKGH